MTKRRQTTPARDLTSWLPWAVVLLPAIVFLPVLRNGFVWDDHVLLLGNFRFRGLGLSELAWMFGAPRFGQYHPLTWVSFAIDYLLFDTNAAGYHAVNLLLHCANAALLYGLALELLRLCLPDLEPGARRWGAAFAALFFALHPLRVESVAWITERRGLLSTGFLLASIWAYIEEERAFSLAFYALSLLSKASGVVLPVVLLLLDYYPLRRLDRRAWLEKLPYAAIALPFALVAPLAQAREGAMQAFSSYGALPRLGQAAYGVVFYLWKTALPFHLSPFVGFPATQRFLTQPPIVLSIAACAGATGLALSAWRRLPAAFVLWFSYLLWLAPVSGLVQSGPHFVADRYSYLACVGWAVLTGALFAQGFQRWRAWTSAGGAAALALLSVLSWNQVGVWRDDESLWTYVLSVEPNSYLARNNLCSAMRDAGRRAEALEQCRAALALRPDYAQAHCNLGNVLLDDGKTEDALAQYAAAVRLAPRDPITHFDLGVALERLGRTDDAVKAYREAIDLKPDYADARTNLGNALSRQSRSVEAEREFQRAVATDPNDAKAHFNLANAYYERQQFDAAAAEFEKALRSAPKDARTHLNLGVCLNAMGRRGDAAEHLRTAIRLKPDFAEAYNNLGIVLFEQGRYDEAVGHFERAVKLNPAYADARYNLERADQLLRSMHGASARPAAR